MAKLPRKTQKIFCSKPTSENQTSVFGTMKTADKQYSTDVGTLQSNAAYEQGWKSATIASYKPFMEDFNTLNYINTSQLAYLFQQGIPEWDEATAYYKNSFCSYNGDLWQSLIDDNLGNAPFEGDEWTLFTTKNKGGGLELCDIGMALYVDETKGLRRYLNGQIVDINANTQAFLTRLKSIVALHPSLLDTEENWQAAKARSPFGQVGRFVFNYSGDEIVSVRLPRVVNVQGLFDLQNLGMTVGQALPSHTHTRGTMDITGTLNIPLWTNRGTSGAFYEKSSRGVFDYGSNSGGYTAGFNANRAWTGNTSGPNYAQTVNDGAVQQEAIQYPYFIQVATGSETENNITNEIELNNPSFFGDSKYVPTEVNNLSWLKSEGQNNPKGTYPSFYDWILENVNNGVDTFKTNGSYCYKKQDADYRVWTNSVSPVVGMSVYGYTPMQQIGTISALVENGFTYYDTKLKADTTVYRYTSSDNRADYITDYDFVINTTDETFRLPLLNGSEDLPSDRYTFNIISNSITTTKQTYTAPANGWVYIKGHQKTTGGSIYAHIRTPFGVETSVSGAATAVNSSFKRFVKRGDTLVVWSDGVSFDSVVSYFQYAQGNGSLYYYVGETVQNANLIDAGRIGEQLPTKLDASKVKAYIVETYRNGYSWYRIYSDGWCEQGGYLAGQGEPYGITTVTLLKPYKDTNYCVQGNIVWGGDEWYKGTFIVNAGSLTDIAVPVTNRTRTSFDIQRLSYHIWYACGYIA